MKKPNGQLHNCLDLKPSQNAIVCLIYRSKIRGKKEVKYKIVGAKVFSMFDVTKAFFHVLLNKLSKLLTAMLAPIGV